MESTHVRVVFFISKTPLEIYSPPRNVELNLFRAERVRYELRGRARRVLKNKVDAEWAHKNKKK